MKKTFNMATMPQRINTAVDTINSIYYQADIIRLYLNNFKEVPKEFIRDKIEIYQGDDLRSSGKLFWSLNKDEYYFCIDDDLIYPPTYAEDMLNKLKEYNDKAIISLHGKILTPTPINSYFNNIQQAEHCLGTTLNDIKVHIIGNGVSLFNTNILKINYKTFKYNYMDDIMVSLDAQKQKIPAIVMTHNDKYLIYNKPSGQTLYDEFSKNDTTQTEMVNTITWNIY